MSQNRHRKGRHSPRSTSNNTQNIFINNNTSEWEENEENINSAIKIQSIIRSKRDRNKVQKLKEKKKKQVIFDNAAAKIQAIERGRKGRRKSAILKEQEIAALKIQTIQRGRKARRSSLKIKSGGLPLTKAEARSGLKQLGRNPFTSNFTYLHCILKDLNLTNINEIINFPNLLYLNISNNNISNINELKSLPYLQVLDASNNVLTDILNYLPQNSDKIENYSGKPNAIGSILREVNLSSNNIINMNDISQHIYLQKLDLSNNHINNIEGLNNLIHLKELNLSNNNINSLNGLEDLSLVKLILDDNNLNTLNPIQNMITLLYISVSNNDLKSLASLRYCNELSYINISNNRISEVRQTEFLRNMLFLKTLILDNNPIEKLEHYELRILVRLPHLLILNNNHISPEKKIQAYNLFATEQSDLEHRKDVFKHYFPELEFNDYTPPYKEEPEPLYMDLAKGDLEHEFSEILVDKIINESKYEVMNNIN